MLPSAAASNQDFGAQIYSRGDIRAASRRKANPSPARGTLDDFAAAIATLSWACMAEMIDVLKRPPQKRICRCVTEGTTDIARQRFCSSRPILFPLAIAQNVLAEITLIH